MRKIIKWLYWHTLWQIHPIKRAIRREIKERGKNLSTKDITFTPKENIKT